MQLWNRTWGIVVLLMMVCVVDAQPVGYCIKPDAVTILGADTVCAEAVEAYSVGEVPKGFYPEWLATNGYPERGAGTVFATRWWPYGVCTLACRLVCKYDTSVHTDWVKQTIFRSSDLPIQVLGAKQVCGDDTATYRLSMEADEVVWSISPAELGSVAQGQYTQSATIVWNRQAQPKAVAAQVLAKVTHCGQTRTIRHDVSVRTTPTLEMIASAGWNEQNDLLGFIAKPLGSRYDWDFGDGEKLTTTSNLCEHRYPTDGTFAATVTVHQPEGCASSVMAATTLQVWPTALVGLSSPNPRLGKVPVQLVTTVPSLLDSNALFILHKNGKRMAQNNTGLFEVRKAGAYTIEINHLGMPRPWWSRPLLVTKAEKVIRLDQKLLLTVTNNQCGEVSANATVGAGVRLDSVVVHDPDAGRLVLTTTNITHSFSRAGHYLFEVHATEMNTLQPLHTKQWVSVALVPELTTKLICENNQLYTHLIDASTSLAKRSGVTWTVDNTTLSPNALPALLLRPGSHTIRLRVTDSLHTCAITKSVTVPEPPQASFTSLDKVCETEAVQFFSTSRGNLVSHLWDFDGYTSSGRMNTSKTFPCVPNPMLGSFCGHDVRLTVTDAYGCYSQVKQKDTVYEDYLTKLDFMPTFQTAELCAGQDTSLAFLALGPIFTGPYRYRWSSGDSGVANGFPMMLRIDQPGNYAFSITDRYGCRQSARPAQVMTLGSPAQLSGDTAYCAGERLHLSIYQGEVYRYQWWRQNPQTRQAERVQGLVQPHLLDLEMGKQCQPGDTFWGEVTTRDGCHQRIGPVVLRQRQGCR